VSFFSFYGKTPDMKSKNNDSIAGERRTLLKFAAAGAVAGIAAPLLAASPSANATEKPMSGILIAYFSRSGNTRYVARQIHQLVGGDLLEIRPVRPYPDAYRATTEQAKIEQETHARPAVIADIRNPALYDRVFLGYPNWWGSIPMGLFTFLEKYRFAGKKIIPFCTHEGSRLGRSEADIRALCPHATLLQGLALRGGSSGYAESASARRDISQWLGQLGMKV
jgi:flavodoxin